jgi:hypothetical protein
MNNRISIFLNSALVGLLVVLLTYLMSILLDLLGTYSPNPGLFFSVICDVSTLQGWLMYWFMAFGMSWGFYRFLKLSRLKYSLTNGLIWGGVFFIISEFVIAIFRYIFAFGKDYEISDKTLSLVILHVLIGLLISYATKFLYSKK